MRRAAVTALAPADLPAGPLYVHLDLDVLDPAEIRGLRYPARDGVTGAELAAAVRMLLAIGRVAAVDLACTWHPGQQPPPGLPRELSRVLAAA